MISCARATRGLRRPSLDARSRRPIRPPSRERLEEREATSQMNRQNNSNHSVAVEVGDDEFGIGNRVGREGVCVLTGH